MPLSCAIVGASSLLPLPAVSVYAVCDSSESNGKALAAALECPWYPSPQAMLTAQPCLEAFWLRPDGNGNLPFDPIMLAAYGRHIFLDLSLPMTHELYTQMASTASAKGAILHVVLPATPVLPSLGEIYAVEVRGFTDENTLSPLDHLPLSLNQGLSVLLSLCGTARQVQGSFDTSATARLTGYPGPDKLGLLISFYSGIIGQLLLLPASDSVEPGWTITVTGSEGCYSFRLPSDSIPTRADEIPSVCNPTLYPTLLSLRNGISASFRQGGCAISI
ncbi:MAG: hypothetical protein IKM13_01805 [Clostridia bacterium]|nr:hypothetical protein [Clostridia bacterium]